MKRISGDNTDLITYRGGGGGAILLGLAFATIGCLVLASMFKEGQVGGAVFALLFIAAGLVLCLGRSRLTLDKTQGTWERWIGILGIGSRQSGKLSSIRSVAVTLVVRRRKKKTYIVYPVRLCGTHGINFLITEKGDSAAARREAEFLARSLDLVMEDSTTGTLVKRQGAEVDQSLRQRRQSRGQSRGPLPEPPPAMRSRMSVEGTAVRIEIPPPGLSSAAVPLFICVVLAAIFFITIFIGKMIGLPLLALGAVAAIPAAILLVLVINVARTARAATIVTVSRDELQLTAPSFFGVSTRSMSADEIEELIIGRPDQRTAPCIMARSDEKTLAFGQGLPAEEMSWIRAVVEATIG